MIHEFLTAALPWVIMGVAVAIAATYVSTKHDKSGNSDKSC